jgi:hypothetical protein
LTYFYLPDNPSLRLEIRLEKNIPASISLEGGLEK